MSTSAAQPRLAAFPGFPDKSKVALETPLAVLPFELRDVRLLDSPFKHAMDLNAAYLLDLDVYRLLHGFYKNAGLETKGDVYEGWESETIAGHTLGHYLTAVALQYAGSGDERFLDRVNTIVDELELCQNARRDGFIGGFPEADRVFGEVKQGIIRSKGFDLNGLWVPWYNLHKTLAGLVDAYVLCDNANALEVVKKLSDWSFDVTNNLDDEQWQLMLACEHGGVNESYAHVYALTGDKRYLELSEKFYHKAILDPLSKREHVFPGVHGNTQFPKVLGNARQYELTGNTKYRDIAEWCWETVVHDHSYAIGGNTSGEYFGPSGKLADRLTMTTAETCNTYNMLKLTRQLFTWEPRLELADYYEQALYNHILASQDPERGMMCYYVSLCPGHFKTFSTPHDAFWCCVGTGIENHTKYGDSIYFHTENELYVNLFIPSVLDWKDAGVKVTQRTSYPSSDVVRLEFEVEEPTDLTLKIRCPHWAAGDVTATIDGSAHATGTPGEYLELTRTWVTGDVLEVTIPMALRLIPMPDKADRAAIAYGPLVLAGDLGREGMEDPMPFHADPSHFFGTPLPKLPVLITEGKPVGDWVRSVASKPLTFTTVGVGQPNDVELKPFFATHDNRYVVYWDLFTTESWLKNEADYRAEEDRLRDLRARTVDHIALGEMQPERDHAFDGEQMWVGSMNGRKFRAAHDGGFFAFDMKVLGDAPVDLVATYWGTDARNREFDICVDEIFIAYQVLNEEGHGRFVDIAYPIPQDLTAGKDKVRIKFRARVGKTAGAVYDVRVVKR